MPAIKGIGIYDLGNTIRNLVLKAKEERGYYGNLFMSGWEIILVNFQTKLYVGIVLFSHKSTVPKMYIDTTFTATYQQPLRVWDGTWFKTKEGKGIANLAKHLRRIVDTLRPGQEETFGQAFAMFQSEGSPEYFYVDFDIQLNSTLIRELSDVVGEDE